MQLDSVTKKKYLVTCLFLWLCIVTWSVLKYTFITKGAMKLVVGYHRKRFCFPEWTVSQHIYTTLHWTSGNSLYVNPLPMVIWVVYCCGFFSVLVTKYIFWIFHFSIVLNLFNFSSELPIFTAKLSLPLLHLGSGTCKMEARPFTTLHRWQTSHTSSDPEPHRFTAIVSTCPLLSLSEPATTCVNPGILVAPVRWGSPRSFPRNPSPLPEQPRE